MASDEMEVTSEHRRQPPQQEERATEPLKRQSSIYSLTLDEIQNTVCEPGKHFGSMNMDEFLVNIWSAEEAPATAVAGAGAPPPLQRQGSLTLPAPLCGKTVDEVWGEIHQGGAQPLLHHQRHVDHPNALGEMTLEDFLVKAGVVREGYGGGGSAAASSHPPPLAIQQHYGLSSYTAGASLGGGAAAANGVYQVVGDGRMGNGYGSPVSSDGGQVDNTGAYGGGEGMEGRGTRKRAAEGSVEKVVERRQRRMIKNRESAARSRARKQAYTVELEAELNQLKEENARLKEDERRVLALRKQLLLESMAEQARAKAVKSTQTLRRCNSTHC